MGATKLLPFVRQRTARPLVVTPRKVPRAEVVTLVDEAIDLTLGKYGDTPKNRARLNVDALQHMAKTVNLLASGTWEAETDLGERCGCAMVAAGRVRFLEVDGNDLFIERDLDAAEISGVFVDNYDTLASRNEWPRIVAVTD